MIRLHDDMAMSLATEVEDELDFISSVDVAKFNVVGFADSMSYDFDFKDYWLTPSRWTKMIRDYLNGPAVIEWLEKVEDIGPEGRGQAMMRTNSVARKGESGSGRTSRKWGSCMMSLCYRPHPSPNITLHSRTSYLGYLSAMDIGVAWMCARHAAGALGLKVEEFSFTWMLEAAQFHHFKSVAWLLNHPEHGPRFNALLATDTLPEAAARYVDARPALRGSRRWMQQRVISMNTKPGATYGETRYNTFRRVWRRYNTEVRGYEFAKQFAGEDDRGKFHKAYKPLPHTMLSELDLGKIDVDPTWDDDE